MKKSDSHLRFTWNFNLALSVPVKDKNATTIANRMLIAACVVTLTLGLAPLVGLLFGSP